MKITNDGIIHTVKTRKIYYSVFGGRYLLPATIQFKLEYLSQSVLPEKIQSLSIEEWFEKMLGYKIVIDSSSELSSEYSNFLKNASVNNEDAFLFVENTNVTYLARTLFQILQKLLPEITINYLEYD